MQDDKTLKWFERHGITPPSHTPHGATADDIRDKLRPLKAKAWRLEGNRLVATTDLGEVVNYIDTNYVMTGVDDQNLTMFKRIQAVT
jgi:hypothetical protein